MHPSLLNPSADFKAVPLPCQSGVAAGAGDNTELTSGAIDLQQQGSTGYAAAILAIAYRTSITAAQNLALTVRIAESDDGTTFGADTTLVNAVAIETGAVTNRDGVFRLDLSGRQRKRYIRIKITMNLSAAGTDTFVYGATVLLFGGDRIPAV